MKRIVLFFLSFLTLWLGGLNDVWAAYTTETFWTQTGNIATAFEEGHLNTATKTLDIYTPAELALFAYMTTQVTTDPLYEPSRSGFEGWTVNLKANLNMGEHYWKPAVFYAPFRGIFNGGGFTIKNLKVDASLIDDDTKSDPARMTRNGFGLFAEVEGTIQDLTIDYSSFYLKETRVSTKGNYLGAICGKLNNGGVLRNCKVINTTVEGLDYIGGLAGLVSSDNDAPTTIVGCNSAAEVEGRSYVGGIAGEVRGNASVRYSLYTFTSNTTLATPSVYASSSAAGYIIGNNRSTATGENKVEKNYFIDQDFTPLNADDHRVRSVFYKVSNNGENTTPWLELDFGPDINYSNSGIIAYENILYYSNKYYAADGEKVIFGLKINDTSKGTYIDNVRVNDDLARKESVGKYSFTMTDHSAEVTATLLADNSWDQFPAKEFSSVDESSKTITIKTAAELGLLAYNVNSGINNYEGWTIELSKEGSTDFTEDKLLLSGHGWVPIGTMQNPFRGTFDGKGLGIRSLVTADSYTFKDNCGLFGYVYNGTIKGVKLYNSIIQGKDYVGGIVGQLCGSSSMVTDCYVDESCNIVATGEYAGGIAGLARIDTKIIGNQCAAPISGVKRVGGIVGQVESKTTIKDNFYTGIKGYVNASGAQGNGWVSYIIGNINATERTLTRNFSAGRLIETTINDYDNPAYGVSSDNSLVTLSFDGEESVATYTTSGIKSYANSLEWGGKRYYLKGATTNITLTAESGDLKNVTASSGTLTETEGGTNKYTLELNSGNDQTDVVISATVGGVLWTDFAATSFASETGNTIEISTPEQLALLAKNVNSGTSYKGWTINLLNNIDLKHVTGHADQEPEWVPIGNYQDPFDGTFNGNGFIISNLTIGADNARPYSGLFGSVYSDTQGTKSISNVKLASSTINGKSYTGGIVGTLRGWAVVENCVVASTVTVNGISFVGGIVGQTVSNAATVQGCVSEATVKGTGNNVGGIVGENNGAVNYSIYNGTSVTGDRNVAACIGRIVRFDTKGTYYTNPDFVSQNSYDKRAYKLSSSTDGLTFTLKSTETLTFDYSEGGAIPSALTYYKNDGEANGFKYGDVFYVGANETATISVAYTPAGVMAIKANGDGTLLKYQGTGYNLTDEDGTGTFTLDVNATDYKLTAVSAADNFEGAGDEEVPYLIRNEQEMLQLALAVNKGAANYKDKYFRLENDLDYSKLDPTRFQPIGTSTTPFQGTFDGNGHTIKGITVNTNTHSNLTYIGIFGYINYSTVKHLKVTGSTFVGNTDSYVGGIVGFCKGVSEETTILDCQVDNSVTVSGKYAAGIAGWVGDEQEYATGIKANVEGCVSAANVTGTICAGGVIGWMRGSNLQVKNCLYTGNSVANGEATGEVTPNKGYGVANYNSNSIMSLDIYYTGNFTDANGADKRAYEIKPAEACAVNGSTTTANLLLEFTEPTIAYSLTGIQGYKVGLSYDGHFYATAGQTAKFTLKADNGGLLSEVTATPAATITETDGVYSLTLGTSNYTISAKVTIDWAGSGTESDPYIIDNIAKMNLLSSRAAAGNEFGGKFFKLVKDLDYSNETVTDGKNFTPIKNFRGTFDGNSHFLSGITIDTPNTDVVGIFYSLTGGKLKNLTVKNSTIRGNYYVGGIAGVMSSSVIYADPAIIENCYVDEDVYVEAVYTNNANAGGLVGYFNTGVSYKVIGNVCKAKVKAVGGNAGGIGGRKITNTNGDIYDNLYLGTASDITGTNTGAIFGMQESRLGKVNTNFFTDPDFATTQYESLAYAYENVTYNAEPTANHGRVSHYEDNSLVKCNNTFYSRYQKGDANGDGVVNITDVVAIVNYINNASSTAFKKFAADANGDGEVNITDVVKVVNTINKTN